MLAILRDAQTPGTGDFRDEARVPRADQNRHGSFEERLQLVVD
jgi:hypothetical protein